MDVRVIVPLIWNSDLRINLFTALSAAGYRWSGGDLLSSYYPRFEEMQYIAIYVNAPIIKFSSKLKNIDHYKGVNGYNYIVSDPTVNRVIASIRLISKFIKESSCEEEIDNFINSHHFLLNEIKLL